MHQLEAREREEADPSDHQDAVKCRVWHGVRISPRLVDPTRVGILAAISGVVLASLRPSKRDSEYSVKANLLERRLGAVRCVVKTRYSYWNRSAA
jgi:hypothetical protein